MLLWALWLLPGLLEVFSLPPFLNTLEHSLLLHTLRTYPTGLPADELCVGPTAAPIDSDDDSEHGGVRPGHGSPRHPRSPRSGAEQRAATRRASALTEFPSGMSYVVMKAKQQEE